MYAGKLLKVLYELFSHFMPLEQSFSTFMGTDVHRGFVVQFPLLSGGCFLSTKHRNKTILIAQLYFSLISENCGFLNSFRDLLWLKV